MIPAWISLVKRCVSRRSRVKIDAESPKRTAFARSSASSKRRVAVERGDRPEDLLARELGVVREPLEDGRRDEVALVVRTLASREHRAACRAALDRAQDVLQGALVDDGADLDLRIGGIADLPGGGSREELLAEAVVHGVLDEDATSRGALLPGRPEGARVGRLDRAVELGRGGHDQRVVAAELELDAAGRAPSPRRVPSGRPGPTR